jgi:hypothetical protein
MADLGKPVRVIEVIPTHLPEPLREPKQPAPSKQPVRSAS